jgi:hypothetical protein
MVAPLQCMRLSCPCRPPAQRRPLQRAGRPWRCLAWRGRLSTTEAQLQASQKAASSKLDMAGAAWPGLSSLNVPVTGRFLCIPQHPAGVNSLYIWIKGEENSLILLERHGCREFFSSGSRNRAYSLNPATIVKVWPTFPCMLEWGHFACGAIIALLWD